MTKVEELLARIEALEAQLQENEPSTRLQYKQDAPSLMVRPDNPGSGGGWVITTPTPYNGATYGINFANGYGIVDVELPGADLLVTRLVGDFGYQAHALNEAELLQFRKRIATSQVADSRSLGEKLAQPMRL